MTQEDFDEGDCFLELEVEFASSAFRSYGFVDVVPLGLELLNVGVDRFAGTDVGQLELAGVCEASNYLVRT